MKHIKSLKLQVLNLFGYIETFILKNASNKKHTQKTLRNIIRTYRTKRKIHMLISCSCNFIRQSQASDLKIVETRIY